jgi:hypothetical protein
MTSELVKNRTPEEVELEAKRGELARLEVLFAASEEELTTLRTEVAVFERLYLRTLGGRHVALDRLEARIAEHDARSRPLDPACQARAREARARAAESAGALGAEGADGSWDAIAHVVGFSPTESLKRLYREAALRVHPDLAADPADRPRRERIMMRVIEAYRAGDEARLRQILLEWERSPEAVQGEGTGADLVRLIRRIAQVRERVAAAETALSGLRASDAHQLMVQVRAATAAGHDLLHEMAAELDARVRDARGRLDVLTGTGGNAP